MKLQNLDLSKIANGAVQEHFERELSKVIENIMDINTDPKKNRTITLKLKFSADDSREIIAVEAAATSNMVGVEGTPFNMATGVNGDGERVVNELKSGAIGQAYIDDDGEVKNDDGTEAADSKNNIRSLYK